MSIGDGRRREWLANHALKEEVCTNRMTPIETTKEMLAELALTDAEIEEVRDVCDMLAEIVVEGWFEKHKRKEHDRRETESNA